MVSLWIFAVRHESLFKFSKNCQTKSTNESFIMGNCCCKRLYTTQILYIENFGEFMTFEEMRVSREGKNVVCLSWSET